MQDTIIDGCYQVLGKVGEGGLGVVLKCQDQHLHRAVALKVLKKADPDDAEVKTFLSEARKLATIEHPNVVRIYSFGSYEEKPYFVMELLAGETLHRLIERSRPTPRQGCELMKQVALGLQAMHERGIIHRDLSTNNVMVLPDGTAKILDLGLSKSVDGLSTVTGEGKLVGTIPYMAPERIEGGNTTQSSDLFSFGIILFEVLTGVHPFEAEHYMSVLYNIVHRAPKSLQALVPGLPPELGSLLDDCLAKDPQDRPPSLQEISERLTDVQRLLESGEQQLTVQSSVDPKPHTPKNPYMNRIMIKDPEAFFGRRQEVRRIYSRFNATPPGSISIVGDRKIGKSSLLNFIYSRRTRRDYLEEPDRAIMLFLDLQSQTGTTLESFCEVLLRMASLETRGRVDLSSCTPTLDGIKQMVESMDKAALRLIIILDEFELITINPSFGLEFFSFLRYLANHYNVAYLTSSARDLQSLCHTKEISDSPFFNIFSTMRLSVFKDEEARELINLPSASVNRPLEPFADSIVEMAGYFPLFLQMACCHAVEYAEETDTDPDMKEVRRRFLEEAYFHYRYFWDRFDTHEQSAIRRIASGREIPAALKHVAEELERRGYLRHTNQDAGVFSSTFAEFLAKDVITPETPFWKRLFGRSSGKPASRQ